MTARKGHTPEQIIIRLRSARRAAAEVEIANDAPIAQVFKKIGVTDQTYYRWRNEYGGRRVDQAQRLKELEEENAQLKKLVADQAMDISILKEAASGNS
jgi:transposase-like protein